MPSGLSPLVESKKFVLGQVAGGAAGIAVGTYSGMNLLIPGLAGAAIWYAGSKLVHPTQPKYLSALSVQGAHLAWLTFGMAFLGAWGANLIDVVVLAAGLAWLWLRPSIWPVLLLTVFQVFALAVNAAVIVGQPLGSAGHKALVLHILLRLLALGLMWHAFIVTRRAPKRGDA